MTNSQKKSFQFFIYLIFSIQLLSQSFEGQYTNTETSNFNPSITVNENILNFSYSTGHIGSGHSYNFQGIIESILNDTIKVTMLRSYALHNNIGLIKTNKPMSQPTLEIFVNSKEKDTIKEIRVLNYEALSEMTGLLVLNKSIKNLIFVKEENSNNHKIRYPIDKNIYWNKYQFKISEIGISSDKVNNKELNINKRFKKYLIKKLSLEKYSEIEFSFVYNKLSGKIYFIEFPDIKEISDEKFKDVISKFSNWPRSSEKTKYLVVEGRVKKNVLEIQNF